jgi:hypothetical protein
LVDRDGIEVNAYALKELKIGSECLASLTCGLHNLQRVQEIVRVTVKYWYDLLGPLVEVAENGLKMTRSRPRIS